jgi:biopolymer transport protein ExbB
MISLLQTADAVVVAEQTRMGLWQLFMSGGWLMWVLLILGGLTIFIFVERFMAIRKASEFDMNFMNRIRDYILDGKVAAAVDLCRKTLPGSIITRPTAPKPPSAYSYRRKWNGRLTTSSNY